MSNTGGHRNVTRPALMDAQDARNGGLEHGEDDIMPALEAVDNLFDKIRNAYPVECHRGRGPVALKMDDLAVFLRNDSATERQRKVREHYERALMRKADAMKPKSPYRKKILREIRRVVTANFGPDVKLVRRGSARRRTDINGSDFDIGIDRKDRDAIPRRDMVELAGQFESSGIEGLDKVELRRKAIKLIFLMHNMEETYEIIPCRPKYFEYLVEDFPLTRNSTDRRVADVQQLDQLHNNRALQRGCRLFKDIIKAAGIRARGLKSFVAERLLYNVAVREGLQPLVRDTTGLLSFSVAVAPFRPIRSFPAASSAGEE